MEKIRNLSLKKTIFFYLLINLFSSFLLCAVLSRTVSYAQEQIWLRYVDEEALYHALNDAEGNYQITVPRPSREEMSPLDWQLSELCDFVETYGILLLSVCGSGAAVALFYRNKLKRPIEELKEASRLVARDELDFHLEYENRDEMGMLCLEFEKMRSQLAENNRILWRMVEEEKALRAAVAHDIRSPLSVLQGYQEMLLEFLPEGTLPPEKTKEMLEECMRQVQRMKTFLNDMQKLNRLEERQIVRREVRTAELKQEIEKEAYMMERQYGKTCRTGLQAERDVLWIDRELVLEVVENLLSNSFRYAKKQVTVEVISSGEYLEITVADDGCGFQESAETVTRPFYHANPQDDLKHSGMGMYLCRVFCERHGGRLLVGNGPEGGAKVRALFGLW